jgi:hypothetical protein
MAQLAANHVAEQLFSRVDNRVRSRFNWQFPNDRDKLRAVARCPKIDGIRSTRPAPRRPTTGQQHGFGLSRLVFRHCDVLPLAGPGRRPCDSRAWICLPRTDFCVSAWIVEGVRRVRLETCRIEVRGRTSHVVNATLAES